MRVRVRGTFVLLFLLLSGCGSDWNTRYGPGGVIDANRVDVTVSRQAAVLQALATRYGIRYSGYGDDYYLLTLAGFNYSDEICSYYLDNLHRFERQKNRIKDTLTLATTTATAIMAAGEVSEEAVVYVTQALGFTSGWVGILADSYLYRLSPGILSGIVKSLHDAYRKNTAEHKAEVNSLQMAYYNIREYYSLCLPVTIEAKIEEYLSASKATATTPPGSSKAAAAATNVILTPQGLPVYWGNR